MSLLIAVYPTKQLWNLLSHGMQLTHWSLRVDVIKLSLRIGLQCNIGLGNDLVPSGNKPLPESVLTYVATWCH